MTTLLDWGFVKNGIVKAKIEIYQKVQKNVLKTSADKRAGTFRTDIIRNVAYISAITTLPNGKEIKHEKKYFCDIQNDINEAFKLFETEFKTFLPRY